jgi:urea transport system permease protein
MSPANSIEIAIWVALGGRGTLVGPIIGAGVVNGAKSYFTQAFPEYWLYFLGLLFILATLFLPKGIAGLAQQWRERRARAAQTATGTQPKAPRTENAASRERMQREAAQEPRAEPGMSAERSGA